MNSVQIETKEGKKWRKKNNCKITFEMKITNFAQLCTMKLTGGGGGGSEEGKISCS